MNKVKHKEVLIAVDDDSFLRLHVANTFWQRLLGWRLRNRCDGVWLLPCRSVHTFGMREPLDLLWLNAMFQPQQVHLEVPPHRIIRCRSAYSVIELPAGRLPSEVDSIRLLTQGRVK